MPPPAVVVIVHSGNYFAQRIVFKGDCLTSPRSQAKEWLLKEGFEAIDLDGANWAAGDDTTATLEELIK